LQISPNLHFVESGNINGLQAKKFGFDFFPFVLGASRRLVGPIESSRQGESSIFCFGEARRLPAVAQRRVLS
jgi:hypothetical protein